MKAKYDQEVRKAKPGQGQNGQDKDNQTSWIFFDRETLEGLLAKADKDSKVGGIQFFFTEYTEETATKMHPEQIEAYTGQMTLVMRAANLYEKGVSKIELAEEDDEYQNNGKQCPPKCDQEPTGL